MLAQRGGDSITVQATGIPPTFITQSVLLSGGPPSPATLEIQSGDTLLATYQDSNPSALAKTTATVNCRAKVETSVWVSGGCSADSLDWPVPLPQILDA